jgi:hypothetical protein
MRHPLRAALFVSLLSVVACGDPSPIVVDAGVGGAIPAPPDNGPTCREVLAGSGAPSAASAVTLVTYAAIVACACSPSGACVAPCGLAGAADCLAPRAGAFPAACAACLGDAAGCLPERDACVLDLGGAP